MKFLLKKDLPTLRAGRVIQLTKDGKFGFPILIGAPTDNSVQYVFPISVLKNETEWFQELEEVVNGKRLEILLNV